MEADICPVWNAERQHTERLLTDSRYYAEHYSALLAEALAPSLTAANRTEIINTLAGRKDDRRLRYAGVYNNSFELLASLGTVPALTRPITDVSDRLLVAVNTPSASSAVARAGCGRALRPYCRTAQAGDVGVL